MYDHLAGRLRQLKIRQADLAHHWGISQTSVSQRFTGNVAWNISEMYDLLRICHARPEEMHIYFPNPGPAATAKKRGVVA